MGKTQLVRYVVTDDNGRILAPWRATKGAQQIPADGRPTVQNLIRWRDNYNLSLCKGGANEHIGIDGWIQRRIAIYDQYTRRRIVTYSPPMFEVIPTAAQAASARAEVGLFSRPQTAAHVHLS